MQNEDYGVFETDNLGVAAYVALRGLSHCGNRKGEGKGGKFKIFFRFDDPGNIGQALERDYFTSKEKQYRDLLFFFRGEVETSMRSKNGSSPKSNRSGNGW